MVTQSVNSDLKRNEFILQSNLSDRVLGNLELCYPRSHKGRGKYLRKRDSRQRPNGKNHIKRQSKPRQTKAEAQMLSQL